MMALGLVLYGAGVGSVFMATEFPHFLLSMSILSIGEMVAMPIANTVTADMAPEDLRGRYMGILGITWSAGFGIGPSLGGFVADQLGMQNLWQVMGSIGLVAAAAYLLMERVWREQDRQRGMTSR